MHDQLQNELHEQESSFQSFVSSSHVDGDSTLDEEPDEQFYMKLAAKLVIFDPLDRKVTVEAAESSQIGQNDEEEGEVNED